MSSPTADGPQPQLREKASISNDPLRGPRPSRAERAGLSTSAHNSVSEIVIALTVSLVFFASILVGLQYGPTVVRCHHDRGFLSWRGIHLVCTGERDTHLGQVGD